MEKNMNHIGGEGLASATPIFTRAGQFPQDFTVAPINPTSADLEIELLSQVLFDPQALTRIEAEAGDLPAAAFTTRNHRLIWVAIQEVAKDGNIPDLMAVLQKLHELGTLPEVTRNKVCRLMENPPVSSLTVGQNAKLIKENYNRYIASLEFECIAKAATEEGVEAAVKKAKTFLEKLATPVMGLHESVARLLSKVKSASELKAATLELASRFGYQSRDLEHIASLLEQEEDREVDLLDAATQLPQHTFSHQQDIDPHRYLWGDGGRLADAIAKTAAAMPTAIAPIFTTFLPAAASCIGREARIIASVTGKYTQPCVLWTMVVAPTGALKTPTQKVVTDVLVELELEAFERYKSDLSDWEEEMKNLSEGDPAPPKPIRKRYLTQDATIEALECILADNPGLLGYRDELAGDFKAANAYRGGRGADEQIMLALWNGSAVVADRRSRQVTLGKSAFSRTGAIQFEVLQEISGNHTDTAGMLARFLVCAVDSPPRYYKAGQTVDHGLDVLLKDLFEDLKSLPERDYFLTPQAEKLFEKWQNRLVDAERAEKHPGVRAAFPKIEAYALRLALHLHVTNSQLAKEELPGQQINAYVMSRAIELANFYLGQIKLIYAVNSPQSGLGGRLLNLWLFIKKKIQGVTPRDIKRNVGSYRNGKIPTNEIRQDCLSLVQQGYLRCEGDTFYPQEVQWHNVTTDVTSVVTSSNSVTESIPDCDGTNVTDVTTTDFEDLNSQTPPGTAPPQERVVAFEDELLDDPWAEPLSPLEEVVTFVPSVTSEPKTPSGTGFGDVTTDCDNSCDIPADCDTNSPSVPSGTGFAAASDNEAAAACDADSAQEKKMPRMPEPHELADRLFSRGTWKAILSEIDAIAAAMGKSRAAVFNKIKKCVSGELRRHLIQLLAEEMRWSRHNSELWDWLSGCARKLLAEATELAQPT